MKNFTNSPFTSFACAIGRFFGLDIFIIGITLINPRVLFPWLIQGVQGYLEKDSDLIYYAPYLVLFMLFFFAALLRSIYLNREGLASPSKFNVRMVFGNVLVISTIAAIAFKRHMAEAIGYVSFYERSILVLDMLFVWVVANFILQLAQWFFYVFFTTKDK